MVMGNRMKPIVVGGGDTANLGATVDLRNYLFITQKAGQLLDANIDVLNRLRQLLASGIGGGSGSDMSPVVAKFDEILSQLKAGTLTAEVKEKLLSGAIRPLQKYTYKLDSARTDEAITIDGTYVLAWTDGDPSAIGLKLNTASDPVIYFDECNPLISLFGKVYLTHTAQAGKTLVLITSVLPIGGSVGAMSPGVLTVAPNMPVSNSQTWTNPASNPSLVLDCAGRSVVEFWVSEPTGSKTVRVYGSLDGSSYRETTSYTTGAATKTATDALTTGYRYIKIEIENTAAGAYVIELSASGR